MNFRIKVIFRNVSAWHESPVPDVIGDGRGCLRLWSLADRRTSHARLIDFLIEDETLLCQSELQEYQ